MDIKVSARPTHYQVLGVEPTASNEEIARAFSRKVGVFAAHDLAGLAKANIAFKTLRDPKLRQDYDASLAPKPEPKPEIKPWVAGPKYEVSLLETNWSELMRPVGEATPSAPAARPEPRPDPVGKPATGAFIASSLRQPAAPVAAEPAPKAAEPAPAPPVTRHEEHVPGEPPMTFEPSEASAIEWKRTGLLVGGPLAAVVLTAGIAGWWSAREIGEPAATAPSATLAVPPAQTASAEVDASPALTGTPVVARAEPAAVRSAPVRRAVITRPAAHQTLAPPAEPQTETVAASADPQPSPQNEADEPYVDVSRLKAAAAANMPLPNRTIARTIQRIGYSCGQVASTTAVAGSPGVFKVSCTSGQAYQARPVGGRYHFRRWGRE